MTKIANTASKNITLVLVCILSIALGAALFNSKNQMQPAYAVDQSTSQRATLQNLQNGFVAIADDLEPAVVNITSEKLVDTPNMPDIEQFFRGFPFQSPNPRGDGEGGGKQRQQASGSGVVIKSDAKGTYIVTNDHVVGGADRVTVKFKDGNEYKGTVMRDPQTDLAIVKIDAKNMPSAKLGDSSKVKVGQWAIAIGNPFGLNNTLTVGVVSAVTREFAVPDPDSPSGGKYYPDAIQTDASINPGNSGGPLVNIDGEIIGINSAIYSPSGGNVGVGFAVPSNTIKFVLNQLIEKGKVVRGYLGLLPENLTPVKKDKYGLKEGAVVASVSDETPASKAGIQPEDVITEIDGKKVKDALDLRRSIAEIAPGTKVKVVLVRGKKEQALNVTVGEAPDKLVQAPAEVKGKVGMNVESLTPDTAKELGIKPSTKGVVVSKVTPGSPADRAGIQRGDVILKVDDRPTATVEQYQDVTGGLKAGSTILVLVLRGDRTMIAEMTLD